MNSNPLCGNCGAPVQPGSQYCTNCGASMGAGAASAPAGTPASAGWQPGAPAGNAPPHSAPAPQQSPYGQNTYGQNTYEQNTYGQNTAPPQGYPQGQGYQAPPYQGGGYGQQPPAWQAGAPNNAPGYGGAYHSAQQVQPQKKRRGGVIALIVVLVVAVVLGLSIWLASREDTTSYGTLAESSALGVQGGASTPGAASEGSGGMAAAADTPLLVDYRSYDLTRLSDGMGFSFDALNQSGKTITYFEAWVFCFDENGNEVLGDDGSNMEWVVDEPALPNGSTHTPDDNGYWLFYNCSDSDVAIVVPYINYVEFSDGMSWGKTAETAEITDVLRPEYDTVRAQAEVTARTLAGQMSFRGLPVADNSGN